MKLSHVYVDKDMYWVLMSNIFPFQGHDQKMKNLLNSNFSFKKQTYSFQVTEIHVNIVFIFIVLYFCGYLLRQVIDIKFLLSLYR